MFAISSPIINVTDSTFNNSWDYLKAINPEVDIILAFSRWTYSPFIICGEYEFYPKFSFRRSKLKKNMSTKIRAEIIVRIKDVGIHRHQNLEKYIKNLSTKRTVSGHIGIDNILRTGAGIRLNNYKDSFLIPSELFKTLLANRVSDEDGNGFEIEIFTTQNKDIAQLLSDIEYSENQMRFGYVLSDLYYSFLKRYKKNSLFPAQ